MSGPRVGLFSRMAVSCTSSIVFLYVKHSATPLVDKKIHLPVFVGDKTEISGSPCHDYLSQCEYGRAGD